MGDAQSCQRVETQYSRSLTRPFAPTPASSLAPQNRKLAATAHYIPEIPGGFPRDLPQKKRSVPGSELSSVIFTARASKVSRNLPRSATARAGCAFLPRVATKHFARLPFALLFAILVSRHTSHRLALERNTTQGVFGFSINSWVCTEKSRKFENLWEMIVRLTPKSPYASTDCGSQTCRSRVRKRTGA